MTRYQRAKRLAFWIEFVVALASIGIFIVGLGLVEAISQA